MSDPPAKTNPIIYVVVIIIIILLYFGYTKYKENKEKDDIADSKNSSKKDELESYDLESEVSKLKDKQEKILDKITNDVGI